MGWKCSKNAKRDVSWAFFGIFISDIDCCISIFPSEIVRKSPKKREICPKRWCLATDAIDVDIGGDLFLPFRIYFLVPLWYYYNYLPLKWSTITKGLCLLSFSDTLSLINWDILLGYPANCIGILYLVSHTPLMNFRCPYEILKNRLTFPLE